MLRFRSIARERTHGPTSLRHAALRRAVKLAAAAFGFLALRLVRGRAATPGREAAEGRAEKGARPAVAPR